MGDYFSHGKTFCFGCYIGEKLVGLISFCVQVIGEEQGTPEITVDGEIPTEAKISGFVVDPEYRKQGIGMELQLFAIEDAGRKGCYQLA